MKDYQLGLYEKAMPELPWRDKLLLAKCAGYDFVELSIDATEDRIARVYSNVAERNALRHLTEELGIPFTELRRIFEDDALREKLESIVYPLLVKDLQAWKASLDGDLSFIESAVALGKPCFDGLYDKVLLVTAPRGVRESRNPEVARRDALQTFDASKADYTITNAGSIESLHCKTDKLLKKLI